MPEGTMFNRSNDMLVSEIDEYLTTIDTGANRGQVKHITHKQRFLHEKDWEFFFQAVAEQSKENFFDRVEDCEPLMTRLHHVQDHGE